MINKLSLGSEYDHLPKEKILQFICSFIKNESSDNLLLYLDEVEETIKSIINIFVYKQNKSNTHLLLKILMELENKKSLKIDRLIQKNFFVLINFI